MNTTEIVFILDKSGSMSGLEKDTIGGFNALIEKQKKEDGKAYVSTFLFANRSELVHDRIDVKDVPAMTDKDYFVGGCTALLDAVGSAIEHIGKIHKYARKEDVPAKTLFVITTDGEENSSREYTHAKIRKMIEAKKEAGWEFLFLGANIDAQEEAKLIGIDEDKAATYRCDETGTDVIFNAVGEAVSCIRSGCAIGKAWKKPIDEDVKKRGRR